MIQRLAKLGKARSQFHDLYCDIRDRRVEVKFSRAMRTSKIPVTEHTVLQCIEAATSEKRLIAWSERIKTSFDCNIQQIKRREFDDLYYGVFFSDVVTIFHIESRDIGPHIGYSDKQHKGNVGEGQFHINQDTIRIHEENYLYKKLTYARLLQLIS